MKSISKFLPIVIVVALVAAGVIWMLGGKDDTKTVTAYFPRAVSVYEGSDVRVLGVPVGKVEKVVPEGTRVKVTMRYDGSVKVPADAQAVIVSPSVVGDRYIQLAPAYKSGKAMPDNSVAGHRSAPRSRWSSTRSTPASTNSPSRSVRRAPTKRRRAHRPARADGQELRRPGRRVQPDDQGLRSAQRDPGQEQEGPVRVRAPAAVLREDARRERRHRAQLQPLAGQRLAGALRRATATWRPRSSTSAPRSTWSASSSRRTRAC